MDRALPRLIHQARTGKTDVGVIMLDVDYFKLLNDSRGHATGDNFLRNLGQLIKSGVKADRDLAFRIGGDEFVIVCAAATADACKALADRLVMLSEALGKTYRLPSVPKLSAGWGLLSESPDASAAALVALADKRLYEAKASRRAPLARAS
jgi:diguanylate cyclase (GGDEF)-like protein